MAGLTMFERRRWLIEAMGGLTAAESIEALIGVLKRYARGVAGSDGITVIRRRGDQVAYVAEDAMTPLWTGRSFPLEKCISGLAMIENRPLLLPDVFSDSRVPHAAYRPTFVRSMAMFPIGQGVPMMAVGSYWGAAGAIDENAVAMLGRLAASAGMTLDRLAPGNGGGWAQAVG